jgi:hypothetical protein
MQFTHGQRVTCEIQGKKVTDARISIDEDGTPYICQNEINGLNTDTKLGYKYSWRLTEDFTHLSVTNLKPLTLAEKDIGDITSYEVGDILYNKDIKCKRKVLGICGLVVFLSYSPDLNQHYGGYTVEQIKKDGWSFLTETPKTVVTKEEIAQWKGVRVEDLEIKE